MKRSSYDKFTSIISDLICLLSEDEFSPEAISSIHKVCCLLLELL